MPIMPTMPLLLQTLAPEVLGEIEKDIHRTFPNHPRMSTPEGQQAMLNVLRAYALSDPEIGYTQVGGRAQPCWTAGMHTVCGHAGLAWH